MDYYYFILLCTNLYRALSYPLTCPVAGHWRLRALSYCPNPDQYNCLLDTVKEMYTEKCIGPRQEVEGFKTTFNSGNFDRIKCSPRRYQPDGLMFEANEHSDCVFQKSRCSDEGQMIYQPEQVSPLTDIKCICDYTKSYAFVNGIESKCFCDPSKDDCSCFKKSCASDEEMTAGFECVRKVLIGYDGNENMCWKIKPTSSGSGAVIKLKRKTEEKRDYSVEGNATMASVVVTILVLFINAIFIYMICGKWLKKQIKQYKNKGKGKGKGHKKKLHTDQTNFETKVDIAKHEDESSLENGSNVKPDIENVERNEEASDSEDEFVMCPLPHNNEIIGETKHEQTISIFRPDADILEVIPTLNVTKNLEREKLEYKEHTDYDMTRKERKIENNAICQIQDNVNENNIAVNLNDFSIGQHTLISTKNSSNEELQIEQKQGIETVTLKGKYDAVNHTDVSDELKIDYKNADDDKSIDCSQENVLGMRILYAEEIEKSRKDEKLDVETNVVSEHQEISSKDMEQMHDEYSGLPIEECDEQNNKEGRKNISDKETINTEDKNQQMTTTTEHLEEQFFNDSHKAQTPFNQTIRSNEIKIDYNKTDERSIENSDENQMKIINLQTTETEKNEKDKQLCTELAVPLEKLESLNKDLKQSENEGNTLQIDEQNITEETRNISDNEAITTADTKVLKTNVQNSVNENETFSTTEATGDDADQLKNTETSIIVEEDPIELQNQPAGAIPTIMNYFSKVGKLFSSGDPAPIKRETTVSNEECNEYDQLESCKETSPKATILEVHDYGKFGYNQHSKLEDKTICFSLSEKEVRDHDNKLDTSGEAKTVKYEKEFEKLRNFDDVDRPNLGF